MTKIISLHDASMQEFNYQSDIKAGKIIPSDTGFRFLNERLLGGANDTDVIMISALSGVGKSTLMLRIGYNIATLNPKNRVLYFSFEMPGRKLAGKLVSKMIQKSLKEMYAKDAEMTDKTHFEAFKDVPFDIIEVPLDVETIKIECNKYAIMHPDCRCHYVFDHSMIVRNNKGDNSMETLEALANACNDDKKIGSRCYWIVSQLNDKIQNFSRGEYPSGHMPRLEDIYGSKTVPHSCNNIVVLIKPKDMNLNATTFTVYDLPFTGKYAKRKELGDCDMIYAITIKARDGSLGIDPLYDNLKNSELIEMETKFYDNFKATHNFP